MLSTLKLLKAEGDALGAYLLLREGLALKHGNCLVAVAVSHGHKDWNVVSALGASPDVHGHETMRTHDNIAAQSARLGRHLAQRYDVAVEDAVGAIAAMRWGALVAAANETLGDPVAARKWLHAPHPGLHGVPADELVDTDDGYARVERLLIHTL